jgi:hypothetical protein
MAQAAVPIPRINIGDCIRELRGERVILDLDLAELFGVTTKRLNEQVKRNQERFPEDFMFQLSDQEVGDLRSQFATAKWSKRRGLPYAFTEHGAVMAANVLNSPIAVHASIVVVRAFVRIRRVLTEHADLKHRLDEIERRLVRGFAEHEQELLEIRFLINGLEQPTAERRRKAIGFRKDEEAG